jgi:hypothetical protein
MEIEDTLSFLGGTWMLRRAIVDHLTRVSGSFDGEAEVRLFGRRGRYEEHGRLRFGRYDGSARRALELIGTDGNGVVVRFEDGRPFFELDLATGGGRAAHQCSEDRYELAFEVNSPDELFERWRVRGPHKNYEAQTTWRRR